MQLRVGRVIVALAIGLFATVAHVPTGTQATSAGVSKKAPVVQVELYGESLCPYCREVTTGVIEPLFQQHTGISAIFNFSYVAWGNAARSDEGIICQHGDLECALNRVIACSQGLYADQRLWFPFVTCIESLPSLSTTATATTTRSSASDSCEAAVNRCSKEARLDAPRISACATGKRGRQLEREAEAATAALQPTPSYVPWVVVNGVPVGQNYGALRSIVCAAYSGDRPKGCFEVPAAVVGARVADDMDRSTKAFARAAYKNRVAVQ